MDVFVPQGTFALLALALGIRRAFISYTETKKQTQKVHDAKRNLENGTVKKGNCKENNEQIYDTIKKLISYNSERVKNTMILANGRANDLYVIGCLLTSLAMVSPFSSLYLYITSAVIDPEAMEALQSLVKLKAGVSKNMVVPLQKDWRVLFSGVSFGFLFLGAASFVFKQHRKQAETAIELAKEVDYFERLNSVITLSKHVYEHQEKLPNSTLSLVNDITDKLTKPHIMGTPEKKEEKVPVQENLFLKQLELLIKSNS